ncbi:hypothetical protein [Kineococcus sp. SYSU DK005]|uniref:hypothetical protein n=1 Tax=Kineococcus sp. SYSU DK005 TaxID=3383126 RepID=UPI003D7EC4EB
MNPNETSRSDPDENVGEHSATADSTGSTSSSTSSSPGGKPGTDLQQELDAVAAAARAAQRSAGQARWQRHQQLLAADHRSRPRREHGGRWRGSRAGRGVLGGTTLLAAVSAAAAGAVLAAWLHPSGGASSVRLVPAAPTSTPSEQSAGPSPAGSTPATSIPAATSTPITDADAHVRTVAFEQVSDLARQCAQPSAQTSTQLSTGAPTRAGSPGWSTVFAARSALSAAVGTEEPSGQHHLCYSLPGGVVGDAVIEAPHQQETAAAGASGWSAPVTAPDGSQVLSVYGWAQPSVKTFTVSTGTGASFSAVVRNGIWWASPRTSAAGQSQVLTWQAFDADEQLLSSGQLTRNESVPDL